MDNFCGSEFWNLTVTWYTNDPDLTECFQSTVLVWSPCVFLWVFSPLKILYILNSKYRNIPWNWLNISKLLLTSLLIILTIVDGCLSVWGKDEEIYPVDYSTPLIKLASFTLAAVFVWFDKQRGMRVSGLLFLFWFFLTVFGTVQLRSEIRKEINGVADYTSFNMYILHIMYFIYYPIILILVILNCMADEQPAFSEYETPKNPCPEQGSGFVSQLLFSWFDPLIWNGYKKPIENKDLWNMNPEDTAAEIVPVFEKHLQKSAGNCTNTSSSSVSFNKISVNVELHGKKCEKKEASIVTAIWKSFGATFLLGSLFKVIQDCMNFANPQILKHLLIYIENRDEMEEWKGYFYAVLMFLAASVQTLLLGQHLKIMFLVAFRVRASLVSAIYRKALRLSSAARKESTVGEIVNLMAVDALRFIELVTHLNMLWSAPLQISLALYFLWDTLGPSVLSGLAVMIILIPLNVIVGNKMKILQRRQMKNKDERIKMMNEVLNGIKVLKLYAWEPSFEQRVLNVRNKELHLLKKAEYLNSIMAFIWACAPFLVSLVTFATYVLIDENNVLTPAKAFVSLALFNIMKMPLSMLPTIIVSLIQTGVSIKRINKYMNAEELDPNNVTHDNSEKYPLIIENGTFSWGPNETPILEDINLHIKEGSLVAVVGSVGAGKSSLISALLGEMFKQNGRVNTKGSIAFAPQQAWIQNASLKDNIIFGNSLNQVFYKSVVDACALKLDFDMLPAGDRTEVGEKGINLSGGQKQRVSLARSVYYDADVYFLDDPLSAVDSHVGKHIFENVIGPSGLLRKKTRLLVTHSITYLPDVDNIIVLCDGKITETGTYKELLEKKGAFADFLLQYLADSIEDKVSQADLEELKANLDSTMGTEELRHKLARTISRVSESLSNSGSVDEKNSEATSLRRQTSRESNVDKKSLLRFNSVKEETPKTSVLGEKLIETEKSETGQVKWRVYSHYFKSVGIVMSTSILLLNILFQVFSIGSNIWLAKWSEESNSNNTSTRDMYLGIYGVLGLGQALSNISFSIFTFIGGLKAARIIHLQLLNNIMKIPLSFFDVTPVGRILNRFSKDVDTLDSVMPAFIRNFLNRLTLVLATFFVISYSTPIFITVILPITVLYVFVQRYFVATSRQLKRLESISRSPVYSHFGESITGVSTIRAYRVQTRFITESDSKLDFNHSCFYPAIIANRWLGIRLETVGNLIIFFAALFTVIQHDIDESIAGLSISYALQVTQALNWLVRLTSDFEINSVSVERIKEYGEIKQEAPWHIPSTAPPNEWPQKGEVNFKDYEVRYREGMDLVLKGISFSVNGGEKVGIVGRTGAGKSSLTLALFRIIEGAGGTITIDGHDISQMGLHALRSRLTIIPQDPVLFSGTLRINLDPFDKFSDEEVWRALDHAHLKSFVKNLTAGLNHEVTEGGENLSVGQRQLICLARALLRKTKILVLDEATAAVDLETDDLIQRTIRKEFQECTVLTIAHRLNTIMDSNRVIVLDRGRVVEYDTPTALLKINSSIFYGMAKDAGLI